VSRVHRLRLTDRIFFVNVSLRPRIRRLSESEYALILRVLEASRRRLEFLLCGYVLMPDHWHALIWPQYPLLISQVLHDVKKISTLRLHAARGSAGPLWQHQFWDCFVRDATEFNERLEYMHLNPPVRKGLVKRPEDWRWSSYQNFALDRGRIAACPIQIDYVRLPLGYRA
jgi:putative transposase